MGSLLSAAMLLVTTGAMANDSPATLPEWVVNPYQAYQGQPAGSGCDVVTGPQPDASNKARARLRAAAALTRSLAGTTITGTESITMTDASVQYSRSIKSISNSKAVFAHNITRDVVVLTPSGNQLVCIQLSSPPDLNH